MAWCPMWSVEGRIFYSAMRAHAFARMLAAEYCRPITIMQKDDIAFPFFVLKEVKPCRSTS